MNCVEYGRTNYVKIENLLGLKEALSIFPVSIRENTNGLHAVFAQEGWMGGYDDETDEDIEFQWTKHVMPYVAENEILIVQTIYNEGLRYVGGSSQAFVRKGKRVRTVRMSLEDIYSVAAKRFGVGPLNIGRAQY